MGRRQRLLNALKKTDPTIYDGNDPWDCLIGQVAEKDPKYVGSGLTHSEFVAKRYGVAYEPVHTIYGQAAHRNYRYDFDAALNMAATTLGLP